MQKYSYVTRPLFPLSGKKPTTAQVKTEKVVWLHKTCIFIKWYIEQTFAMVHGIQKFKDMIFEAEALDF